METQTRRAFMSSLAVAGAAVAVPALPAIASPDADRRLIRLCHRWQSLELAFERACARQDDAIEAQGPLPPIPEILQRSFDVWPGANAGHCLPGRYLLDGYDHRHEWLCRGELKTIADGKMYLEAWLIPGNATDDTSLVPVPEASRAHARKCLEAHDQWEAARKARTADEEHWEAVRMRISALQQKVSEQIVALPAHTMSGLQAKLAIVHKNPFYAQAQGIAQSALADVLRIEIGARLNPPGLKEALVASLQGDKRLAQKGPHNG
jgi:hypothetical protein